MVLSRKQKEEKVASLGKNISSHKAIALASLQNLPSKHYNAIKRKIRGQADIGVARTSLLKRALEASKPEVAKELEPLMDGAVALVLTDLDPFKLAKILRQSKSKAPAKPGMVANDDIIVPAGETSLAPGPVLTELKAAKINAKIQGSKIVISSDTTVAKKGEPISDAVCKILAKLGIEPFEIGLKIIAAVSDGVTYPAGVLDVDDSYYLGQLVAAHTRAVNLAVFAEIYNGHSTPLILASAQAKALALQKVVEDKAPKAREAAPMAAPQADASQPAESKAAPAEPAAQ